MHLNFIRDNMQNEQSQQIIARFWQAFNILEKEHGRGFEWQFIQAVGTNIGNFRRIRKDLWRSIEISYLQYIAVKYDVSCEWLLLGVGAMFSKKKRLYRGDLFCCMLN